MRMVARRITSPQRFDSAVTKFAVSSGVPSTIVRACWANWSRISSVEKALLGFGIEPVDDRPRRPCRHEEAEPRATFKLREAELGGCRYAGKQRVALWRGDREGAHLPGCDLRQGKRQDIEGQRDVAGDEILHGRRRPAVGDVNEVDPGQLLELLGDDVP